MQLFKTNWYVYYTKITSFVKSRPTYFSFLTAKTRLFTLNQQIIVLYVPQVWSRELNAQWQLESIRWSLRVCLLAWFLPREILFAWSSSVLLCEPKQASRRRSTDSFQPLDWPKIKHLMQLCPYSTHSSAEEQSLNLLRKFVAIQINKLIDWRVLALGSQLSILVSNALSTCLVSDTQILNFQP